MKHLRWPLLFCALLPAGIGLSSSIQTAVNRATPPAEAGRSLRLPFIANRGQTHPSVRYYVPTPRGTMFVTETGAMVYRLSPGSPSNPAAAVFAEELAGAHLAQVDGGDSAPTVVNIFHGNDPSRWQRQVPTYHSVRMGEVFDGIELTLRASDTGVEKIFHVQPGADPADIRLRLSSARDLAVTASGELEARTEIGPVHFSRPVAYQERYGARESVEVAYAIEGNEYGFDLGTYDVSRALVIDPFMSTYLGGSGDSDAIFDLMFEGGKLYAAGWTNSSDFPGVGQTSPDQTVGGCNLYEGFVAKLDPGLGVIEAATFLGGSGFFTAEAAHALATTGAGDIFVAGRTVSSDFPGINQGSADSTFAGPWEGFVVRLDANLTTIMASTFIGGMGVDQVYDIAFDPFTSNILLAGMTDSSDFPAVTCATPSADCVLEDVDGFVVRIDPSLVAFSAGTYLGGAGGITGSEGAQSLAIDPLGSVIVGGTVASAGLPVVTGADTSFAGAKEGYIVKLPIALDTILAATYLGGSGQDVVRVIARVDIPGDYTIAVGGETCSTNFPGVSAASADSIVVPTAVNPTSACDGFVAKLSSDLSVLIRSSFLGGSSFEYVNGLAVAQDGSGDVFVSGLTYSDDFPGVDGASADSVYSDGEFFIARLNIDMTAIVQSTYVGGVDNDQSHALTLDPSAGPASAVFAGGSARSAAFPGIGVSSADNALVGSEGAIARMGPTLENTFMIKWSLIKALLQILFARDGDPMLERFDQIEMLGRKGNYQAAMVHTRNFAALVDRLVVSRRLSPADGRRLQEELTELIAALQQAESDSRAPHRRRNTTVVPLDPLPSCPIPPPLPRGR